MDDPNSPLCPWCKKFPFHVWSTGRQARYCYQCILRSRRRSYLRHRAVYLAKNLAWQKSRRGRMLHNRAAREWWRRQAAKRLEAMRGIRKRVGG